MQLNVLHASVAVKHQTRDQLSWVSLPPIPLLHSHTGQVVHTRAFVIKPKIWY